MRQMKLIGFLQAQNCSNYPASWRHPLAQANWASREYYEHIGRTLEAGKFHLAFFDDRLAIPDRLGDDFSETVRHGIRAAKLDPVAVALTMGLATEKLGIGVDLLDDLLRTVPRRARVCHGRPAAQRPGCLERRHLVERLGGRQLRPRQASRTRSALRPRRRIHGGRARALGHVGGRRDRVRSREWHLRRSRQGPSPRSQGKVLQFARTVHRAALAAGPSGHHPGRAERAGQGIRGTLGRIAFRHPPPSRNRAETLSRVEGVSRPAGAGRSPSRPPSIRSSRKPRPKPKTALPSSTGLPSRSTRSCSFRKCSTSISPRKRRMSRCRTKSCAR